MASDLKSPLLQSRELPAKKRHSGTTVTPTSGVISEEFPSPATSPEHCAREIPGNYGLPLIGAIKDRLDYFYFQGPDEFFKSRMEKYRSTVFRVNMAPGPFIPSEPRVIVLLDSSSFPILFDNEKIDKTNLLYGVYMPSLNLTGKHRVLAYLDPTEPSHGKLKQFIFHLLTSRREFIILEFRGTFEGLFLDIEKQVLEKGKVDFNGQCDRASFNFLFRSLLGRNPADMPESDLPSLMTKWLFFLLYPLKTFGMPKFLEELILHTFPLPSFLVNSDYTRLYTFFYNSATRTIDDAEEMGIDRDEACHNLIFAVVFNAWGGSKILFPAIMKWVGLAGEKLHRKLAKEIRAAVKSGEGVTVSTMETMQLMKSVVYEVLRLEPPVPNQFGRAKTDLVIRSHDGEFKVKQGEVLFGYQPFATRDPMIFHRAEEFVGERFVGEEEKLLKHVLWSNGRETEHSSEGNKQCAGKDLVVLMARLFLVELFLCYDSFAVEMVGSSVKITSVTKTSN